MRGGVRHVHSTREHRDGQTLRTQRRTVRDTVDAEGAAGDHRHVPFRQAGGQICGLILTVGRRRPGADDRASAFRDVGEGILPDDPQHHRRSSRWPVADGLSAERREGQQRPVRIAGVSRRPPRRPITSRSFVAQSSSRRAAVSRASSRGAASRLMRSAASTGPTRVTYSARSWHGGSTTRDRYAHARLSSFTARLRPGESSARC